jgi:hypothetical protein
MVKVLRSGGWGRIVPTHMLIAVPAGTGPLAELTEIDENLARNDLIAWFQLRHLARREQVLIALGKRATADMGRPRGDDSSPLATTEDLADMVGLSERRYRIRRAARYWTGGPQLATGRVKRKLTAARIDSIRRQRSRRVPATRAALGSSRSPSHATARVAATPNNAYPDKHLPVAVNGGTSREYLLRRRSKRRW